MLSHRLLLTALACLLGIVSANIDFGARDLSARKCIDYPAYPDLYEASFAEITAGLESGLYTSVDLVKAYLARIDEVNLKGPVLRAVIETSPVALAEAAKLDALRKNGTVLGPLHGIPIIVKDNIDTQPEDGMNTTAGSYALVGTITPGDAAVIKGLKKQGAIILAKANLSQWAFWRSSTLLPSGWTSVGGQCTNPYFPFGNPSGSSGGSAICAAIGLSAAALGSDTGGSVIYPSSYQNLVGIRPTIGLVSRTGVVPISEHHDTVGPIARSVTDAAILLNAIAGPDASDNYTLAQPSPVPDYTAGLKKDALKGVRLGVPRNFNNAGWFTSATSTNTGIDTVFEQAIADLEALGATVVEANVTNINDILNGTNVYYIFSSDFRKDLEEYLATLKYVPSGIKNIDDLIDFDNAHPELEEPLTYESQDLFYQSANTSIDDPRYRQTIAYMSLVGKGGIDAALNDNNVTALIFPSPQSTFSAVAGYPQITVPLGFLPPYTAPVQVQNHTVQTYDPFPGLPFGLTFAGTGYSEATLISYAYAFEQATHHRLEKRAYWEAIPKTQIPDVQ
ncbi:amidase signature enzyme [Calocera cornea HHB12733]|uniref:Amidase signature enzyme n=1 Tax=Calocera cornea HHB12733 TaxID=1353952 RepID=A0A165DJ97_9BASI|nr:amidase signature enzyme [Calocera cornea HHB12733]